MGSDVFLDKLTHLSRCDRGDSISLDPFREVVYNYEELFALSHGLGE